MATVETGSLKLIFLTEDGLQETLTISKASSNLDTSKIRTAMNEIINAGAIKSKTGSELSSRFDARLTLSTVSDFNVK